MRDQDYYEKRAKEILKSIHYLTLATVSKENIPWNSPVAHSISKDYKFYFGSPKNTQHAQNIRNNEKGFVVIYDSTAPDGEGEGVYMEVKVKELENKDEVQNAIKIMFGEVKYKFEDFSNESELRIYLIEPKSVWMNDAREKDGLFIDYRVEIKL